MTVAWYDRWAIGAPKTVTLSVPATGSSVTVVHAIPTSIGGGKPTSTPDFTTHHMAVVGGQVTLTLDDDPLYVLP